MKILSNWFASVKRLIERLDSWLRDTTPACVVCGDELTDNLQASQKHCNNCWPTALRRPRPMGMRR